MKTFKLICKLILGLFLGICLAVYFDIREDEVSDKQQQVASAATKQGQGVVDDVSNFFSDVTSSNFDYYREVDEVANYEEYLSEHLETCLNSDDHYYVMSWYGTISYRYKSKLKRVYDSYNLDTYSQNVYFRNMKEQYINDVNRFIDTHELLSNCSNIKLPQ